MSDSIIEVLQQEIDSVRAACIATGNPTNRSVYLAFAELAKADAITSNHLYTCTCMDCFSKGVARANLYEILQHKP